MWFSVNGSSNKVVSRCVALHFFASCSAKNKNKKNVHLCSYRASLSSYGDN